MRVAALLLGKEESGGEGGRSARGARVFAEVCTTRWKASQAAAERTAKDTSSNQPTDGKAAQQWGSGTLLVLVGGGGAAH